MKKIIKKLTARYHKFYHQNNPWRFLHILADTVLILLTVALLALNIFLLTNPLAGQYQSYFNSHLINLKPRPQISVSLSNNQKYIKVGDQLTYNIAYHNSGSIEIKDLMLVLNLDSEVIGGSKKIILDSTKYPELKAVAPGYFGTIKYQAILNTKIEHPEIPNNSVLTAWLEAIGTNKETGNQETIASGNKLTQKISTNLKADAFVKYNLNEGDQLGSGPLPPIAGQRTTYWIFITADTDHNDIKNIGFTASLPLGVELTGRTSVTGEEKIDYNTDNRIVSWHINNLKAPSTDYTKIGAAIEVAVTPETTSSTPTILSNINLSGTDSFTNEQLSISLPDLKTNTAK